MNNGQMDHGNENPTQHLSWWLRKTMRTPVKLVGTGIWTRDLPNASLVRYHRATSLGCCLLFNHGYLLQRGRRVIGIFGSLIWSKTLMELIFNPCGEFRWSPEVPVSQIHFPHLLVGAPGIFSDLLRFVQMLKREWGAESNWKLPYLFIPSKTAT